MKWIALTALVIIGLYIVLCCVLYAMQDRLLYFPTPQGHPTGGSALVVHSGPVALKLWQLHADCRDALLYFGGNAEDVSAKLSEYDAIFPNRAVYLVHYRGYGGNLGAPSEKLLIADALAIYDAIAPRYQHVAVMGRSLGSGVATALATARPVEKVILVTPYDSIAKVAADHYGWAPVRWLIRDSFDSVRRMKDVRAPVLALIAGKDEVILPARSGALVAAIPSSLRNVKIFPNANHNDINLQPGYREAMRTFLAAP